MEIHKICSMNIAELSNPSGRESKHPACQLVGSLLKIAQPPVNEFVGSWPGLRQDVPRLNRFATLRVDQRQLHQPAGLAIDEPERRPVPAGRAPFVPDLQQRLRQQNRIPALRGRNVREYPGVASGNATRRRRLKPDAGAFDDRCK